MNSQEADGAISVMVFPERRLDAANAVAFRELVNGRVAAGQSRLVIDMTTVEFIDSSGLGALVGALKRVGTRGDLAICGIAPAVEKVFRLTRMDRVFQIFPDAASAQAALAQ